MPDYTTIKGALQQAGHTVSSDFDSKMSDPVFVDKVRTALAEEKHNVPDSTTFWKKYGNVQQAAAPAAPAQATAAQPREWGSWDQLVHAPGELVAGFAKAPKALYDVGRDALMHGVVAPVEATISQATRGLSNISPLLGAGNAEDPNTVRTASGRDITPWVSDYKHALESPMEVNKIASDPLMYMPVGEAASLLGKPLAKAVTKIPKVGPKAAQLTQALADWLAVRPATALRDAETGMEAGRAVVNAREAANMAMTDNAKRAVESARALSEHGFEPFWSAAGVDPYASTKALAKQQAASEAATNLPITGRLVARALEGTAQAIPRLTAGFGTINPSMMGSTARAIVRNSVAAGKGATDMALLGAAERGLNAPEGETTQALAPQLSDLVIGGIGGLGAGMLQRYGLEHYPSMNATTNRHLSPDNIELIKQNLPSILNRGFMPKDKFALSEMAADELKKLGAGPYAKALGTVSETNAGVLRNANMSPDDLAGTLSGMIESSPAMQKRESIGIGMDTPFGAPERASMRSQIKQFTSTIGQHKNLPELQQLLLDGLNKSKTPNDFYHFILGNEAKGQRSALETDWLEAPYHPISADAIRSNMEAKIQRSLLDPMSDVAMVNGPLGPEMPALVRKEMEDKLTALLTKAESKGQRPTHISPALASDVRSGMTNPVAYKNVSESQDAMKARQLTNEAFHDAINEELMKLNPYRENLGGAAKTYALWRSLQTLAEHSGNTGLANRLLGFSVGPFTYPHLAYKAGRAVEHVTPRLVAVKSRPTSDTTSARK